MRSTRAKSDLFSASLLRGSGLHGLGLVCGLVAATALLGGAAQAQTPSAADDGGWGVGLGMGFVEEEFMLSFEAPYTFGGSHVSVGPLLQLGIFDGGELVLLSAEARYTRNLKELLDLSSTRFQNVDIFGAAGIGLAHVGGGGFGEEACLINFGFGAEYRLAKNFSATSHMLFNFYAGDLFGDVFSFSWQVIGGRLYF